MTGMAAMGKQRKDDDVAHEPDPDSTGCVANDRGESASSVGRVFAILGAIGDSGQIGISELSQKLGMSKTTVHRVIQTLKALGYVTQEIETERCRLTIRLFELGAKALESVDLVREA